MFVLKVDEDISLRLRDAYHVEEFFNLIDRNRLHLRQWLEWEKYHRNVDDTYQYCMYERENFASQKAITSSIYYQGRVAGSISLMLTDSHFGEIGYWLGKEFSGKGIVTKSVKVMSNFGFNTLKLHKIVLRIIDGNEKSVAVAKRAGYHYEGRQIKQRLLHGNYYDYLVYYHLRENWQDNTAPEFACHVDDIIELRPFFPHHAREAFHLIDKNRKTLRQWLNWVDSHISLKDTKAFISSALEHYGDYDGLDTGIWYQGQFCGQVSFNSWNLKNYKADLGYWLAEPFTGKGIMTKSVRAMIQYGFDVVGLHRIELLCAVQNTRSCAIAERLSFTHEGILRRGELIRNQYYDTNFYALLKPDWKAV